MDQFFSQVFTLLTSETGSLAFHLVLAFSVLGALQITFSHSKGEFNPISLRLALGLGGLLILQLLLFVISGLGWQGLVDSNKLLPPLDRAVTLLSTVLIIWMWISLQPTKRADTIMLVILIILATASILGCVWWVNQPAGGSFNFSPLDVIAQVIEILMLLVGGLLLVVLRTPAWSTGLCMLVLMLLGPILHFVFPQVEGDFSGAVRLSLMAAYPFLLYLPQHIPDVESGEVDTIKISKPVQGSRRDNDQAPVAPLLQMLGQLVLENDPEESIRLVVSSMADFSHSDICLLAKVDEDEEVAVIISGFDRIKGAYLDKIALPIQEIPVFATSYRLGRTRKLKFTGSSLEILHLTRALGLQESGNVLFMPVLSPDGQPLAAFVFMNPYSDTDWSNEDQSTLHLYARALVYLLQRSEERITAAEEIGQAQTMLRLVQEQAQANSLERQKMFDQILVMQRESDSPSAFSWITEEDNPTGSIGGLQRSQSQMMFDENRGTSKLDGDLILALEEISRLRAELVESETRQTTSQELAGGLPDEPGRVETMRSIAEDIRASAGSITESQRMLLVEAGDWLQDQQRKYLERIGNAASRLTHLSAELLMQSGVETRGVPPDLQDLDLSALLDRLLQEISVQLEENKIGLARDFPSEPLVVHSSPAVLENVLYDLLKNAVNSAGENGKVGVSLKLERADGKQDYALAQISDSGPGLDLQAQRNLFSPLLPDNPLDAGDTEDINFAELKIKIETLEGKIWVDSESGQGSVFSLLIPVSAQKTLEPPDWGSSP